MTEPARRTPVLVPVLGVLIALSAVLVGVLAWQFYGDARIDRGRTDALEAARTGLPTLLSFTPGKVNDQLAEGRKLVSGSFAGQFDQLASTVVVPGAEKLGLTTSATVTRAAVIDSNPDQVDVLLFVKQTTSVRGQPPQTLSNQVKLTMARADSGQWLVAGMQPL